MFIARLFIEQPIAVGKSIVLSADQSHYLQNVLRLKPTDPIVIWNGKGGEYAASLQEITKKQSIVQVQQFTPINRESHCQIELAIALLSSDKMDFVIQKAVELGVTSIIPIYCERSIAKLATEKLDKKLSHWEGVILSAANQSKRTYLPILNAPQTFNAACTGTSPLILFTPPIDHNAKTILPKECLHCRIFIGPEGGFSDKELAFAQAQDAFFKTLGPRTLRVETAAVSCLTYLQALWGDFL